MCFGGAAAEFKNAETEVCASEAKFVFIEPRTSEFACYSEVWSAQEILCDAT